MINLIKVIKRKIIKYKFERVKNVILVNKNILHSNPYNDINSLANHILKFDKYEKARTLINEIYKRSDIYFFDKNDIKVIDKIKNVKFYSRLDDVNFDEDTLIYCNNNVIFIPYKEKKKYILYYLSSILNHEIRVVFSNLELSTVVKIIRIFLRYIRKTSITDKSIEFKRNIVDLFASISYVYLNDKNYYKALKVFLNEVL